MLLIFNLPIVRTDTNQTIGGVKLFTNGIKLGDMSSAITSASGITSIPSWLQIGGNLQPSNDNDRNLGTSSKRWKNAYLSGQLSDGTNSVSIADLAALITYAKSQGWIS